MRFRRDRQPREDRHSQLLRAAAQSYAPGPTADEIAPLAETANARERAQWAALACEALDRNLEEEARARVRRACVCIRSADTPRLAKEFWMLRKLYGDGEEYLLAAARYLNALKPAPRCGEVRARDGALICVLARGKCVCPMLAELSAPISRTWCHCGGARAFDALRCLYPEKACRVAILETVASGGAQCAFRVWFEETDAKPARSSVRWLP